MNPSRGSGLFVRDQTAHTMRQEMETMRECPACVGGEIRTVEETSDGRYSVIIDQCPICGGIGMVPKHKVA